MDFEHLWLLVLLPVAVLPLLLRLLRRPGAIACPEGPPSGGASLRARLLPLLRVLEALALAALVVAAAGPHSGARTVYAERHARDIIIVLDTSESMRALDFGEGQQAESRLDGAVKVAAQFIRGREGDRIGLVAFGGRAVTQCPLTFDRELAIWLLRQVRPEMVGKRTALGEAVALGVARLSERGGAIVLISDGQNTAGSVSPLDAAAAARSRGVRVYAVGVGSAGGAPVPVRLPSGRTVLRDRDYPLDEEALRQVAATSGGRYFRAGDVAGLRQAMAEIDILEGRPAPDVRRVPVGRLGWQFACAAGGCLAVLMFASSVMMRTAPELG